MSGRRLVVALALALGLVQAAGAAAPSLQGTWRGSFDLPRTAALSVALRGGTATVSLPAGHAHPQTVKARAEGARLRFSIPGRPSPLLFDGRLKGTTLAGTVSQGSLRGTFTLRRGAALDVAPLGVYRAADGGTIGVTLPGDRILYADYAADEIRGVFGSGATRQLGAALAVRNPVAGTARFGTGLDVTLRGTTRHAERIATRQYEVRFRSGAVLLAGTLTVPAAPGRHPAVAFVHGSGPSSRTDGSVFSAYFASQGYAVLAYDKRGIDQSGGSYPGERATTYSIDIYARDAQAAARFLAAQPEVDPKRVGLSGASQAGWIMPLAASREPAVRWIVAVSGPVVTVGEQDAYSDLTAQGASRPTESQESILAEVGQSGRSGFDPLPSIRKLTIPALWLLGEDDQHVPTAISVERLATVSAGHDFEATVFPSADHFLLITEHALISEALRSHRYADGLFSGLGRWLAARGL